MTTVTENSTLTGLVAISRLPAGEEYSVRLLREKLATMGLVTTGTDAVVVRLIQEAIGRGLLVRSRKKLDQQRENRPSTRKVPVFVRTDVTHVHAPPSRLDEVAKILDGVHQ